mmetsp:Transcript_23757/g.55362  ORF Transcript_23757/g.55362 Transcript_23757/m.55362 type:complete len:89 (+) Transcript_23757:469-735(+)
MAVHKMGCIVKIRSHLPKGFRNQAQGLTNLSIEAGRQRRGAPITQARTLSEGVQLLNELATPTLKKPLVGGGVTHQRRVVAPPCECAL